MKAFFKIEFGKTPRLEIDDFHWDLQEVDERDEVSGAHVHVEDDRLSSPTVPEVWFVENFLVAGEPCGQIEESRLARTVQILHQMQYSLFFFLWEINGEDSFSRLRSL